MDSQPVDLTRFALVSDLYYSIDRRIYKALKVSIRYLIVIAYSSYSVYQIEIGVIAGFALPF